MKNRVTLADVAERAGVSRATASLVVRGTGRVSDATRTHVQSVMDELGYVYNRGAAALRQQSGDTIGVVVTNPTNPFFGELLTSLASALESRGFTCLLAYSGDDVSAQLRAVHELRERQVAGMAIVPATGTPPELVEKLADWSMPHVFMTRYVSGVETHYVGADDVRGGFLAADHLLAHGARSVLYLGGVAGVQSRHDRLAGARQAMATHGSGSRSGGGLTLTDIHSPVSGAGGLAAMDEFLRSGGSLPDAVMCHSDNVAFGVYRAMRIHGLHNAVRLTGYDDIATAALWEPPLTTISTHGSDLGDRAAAKLVAQIQGAPDEPVVELTSPQLVVRQSCGCDGTAGEPAGAVKDVR